MVAGDLNISPAYVYPVLGRWQVLISLPDVNSDFVTYENSRGSCFAVSSVYATAISCWLQSHIEQTDMRVVSSFSSNSAREQITVCFQNVKPLPLKISSY